MLEYEKGLEGYRIKESPKIFDCQNFNGIEPFEEGDSQDFITIGFIHFLLRYFPG